MATKPAADAERRPGQTVTYTVGGKPCRLATRTFTLAFLAQRAIGGAGAAAELRRQLDKAGVADPTRTTWELTLDNGVTVGAVKDGDPLSEPARPAHKAARGPARAAERVAAYQAHKDVVAATRGSGADPVPSATLAAMPAERAAKVAKARRTRTAPAAARTA